MRACKAHGGLAQRAASPLRRSAVGWMLAVGLAAVAGGCSSSVTTPLPDVSAGVPNALSAQQQREAVDELSRQGNTHEEDAERQIEKSR